MVVPSGKYSVAEDLSTPGIRAGGNIIFRYDGDFGRDWMMPLSLTPKVVLSGGFEPANSDGVISGDRQNTRVYRTFQPLSVRTLLSPEQLQDHGLRLAGYETAQGWLVPIDTNDRDGTITKPDWLAGLAERIGELREIAAEEELPFSENSARDALLFAAQLRHGCRPSAFLIGNGNVRLLWSNVCGEQIGLQFIGGGDVQFVAFAQRGDRLAHTMGKDRVAAMMRVIAAIGLGHVLRT